MASPSSISRLLDRAGLRARTFSVGPICGLHEFFAEPDTGHLHIIRSGSLRARQAEHAPIQVQEPTLLFYPRPTEHRFDVRASAEVFCASVCYEAGLGNAVSHSLPIVVAIPFRFAAGLGVTLDLLFSEADGARLGGEVLIDRLCDVLLIQIIRFAIDNGLVSGGVLAGLAHPRLEKSIAAIMDFPGKAWTLESLAALSHQSRNVFSRSFKEIVGTTPAAFLTQTRMQQAQRLLRQGKPLPVVAEMVGFSSQPALSRAFIRETGLSPSEWIKHI